METFTIRPYTKKELALMYFPDSTPRAAVRRLMVWICRCTQLRTSLHSMGYRPSNKAFTPREVRAIVAELGEP